MKDGLVPIRLEMSNEALHDMLGGAPVSSVEWVQGAAVEWCSITLLTTSGVALYLVLPYI